MVASPNSNIGICGTVDSGGSCDVNCHSGYTRPCACRRCSSGTWQNGAHVQPAHPRRDPHGVERRSSDATQRNATLAALSGSAGLLMITPPFSLTTRIDCISVPNSVTSFSVRVWAEESDSIRNSTILVHAVSTDSSLIDLTVSNRPAGLSTPFLSAQLDDVVFVNSQLASAALFPVPTHPLAMLSCLLEGGRSVRMADR